MSDPARFPPYDPEICLSVVRGLLDNIFTWRNEIAAEIAEPDFDKVPSEWHGDLEDDLRYIYTYRGAAAGHAAVGAIAPFLESVFHHEFASLQCAFGERSRIKEHHRWQLSVDDFWDPSVVADSGQKRDRPDLARGVKQLFAALDIGGRFPKEIHTTVTALFSFRNYALHNGYEWPIEARDQFAKLITSNKCERWFVWSKWGGDLWILCARDLFFTESLEMTKQTIQAFQAVRNAWEPGGDALGT
jgi:hypothetical protein